MSEAICEPLIRLVVERQRISNRIRFGISEGRQRNQTRALSYVRLRSPSDSSRFATANGRSGYTPESMSRDHFSERHVTRAKFDNPLHESSAKVHVELPRLEITVERIGGEAVNTSHVFDGEVYRIGSHPSNDLVLDDPTISRFHCRIARQGNAWRVTDAGSTNGTRLGGVKILAAELDADTDAGVLIALGDSALRVRTMICGHVSVPAPSSFGAIIGASAAMQRLFGVLERVAASDIDALIHGESGTGKELVATELVQRSAREAGPVIVVDCGAISPTLVESELFGHVRGAFTGADRERAGAFESADRGTLFLDEIGELPLELQPKLLRVLEAREVRRVGQIQSKRIDVRVIAATNRDLERQVNRGRFREDLYYRLAKVSVQIPALRERLEDIPLLVRSFVEAIGCKDSARLFSNDVIAEMQRHDWPGNVRELKNYIERSVVLDAAAPPTRTRSGTIAIPTVARVPASEGEQRPATPTPFRIAKEAAIATFERTYLVPLLEQAQGNVSKAARAAQMDRMYLHQLAQKYGLRTTRKE